MGRKKIHGSASAKTLASQQKWIDAGNTRVNFWIPNDPAAREKMKELAAQLRRDAGTMLPEDLIW